MRRRFAEGVARVCGSVVCIGGQSSRYYCGKLSAVLRFHRVNLRTELPTSPPLITRALKGVAWPHVAAGNPRRMRRPLGGQGLALSWGAGGRLLLYISRWAIVFRGEVGRNVRLVDWSGTLRVLLDRARRSVVHGGVHRLTQLQWHQATLIELRFRGLKSDQTQQGSVTAPACNDAWGAFRGRSRRRCRRSHGGVAVRFSDITGKLLVAVVSVRQRG